MEQDRTYFDIENPKFLSTKNTKKWSSLFLYDQAFGITARAKDEDGQTLKKADGNTKIGNQLVEAHKRNLEDLVTHSNGNVYNKSIELPSITAEQFNKKDFDLWKKEVGMPIVIRGYLKDAPILDIMKRENLIEKYSDTEIRCVKLEFKSGRKSKVGQNIQTVTTTLKKFLTSEEFANHYINNFFGILGEQEFLDACRGRELNSIMGKDSAIAQWFISRPKETSGSFLHCAPADNIFLNIIGQKEWCFIDPSYTPVMLPAMSRYGMYCSSELDESLEGDFQHYFSEKYKEMKHVPIYKVVLEEGDILYTPSWWWHRVKNLSPLTIGCATRYVDEKNTMTYNRTLYFGMLLESIKHPFKSPFYVNLKSAMNRKNATKVMDSLFTGGSTKKT
ncbi:MAG: hypothetical protein F6K19_33010 [Cyanothece sp. SIO1E1]|nr:hypothetical protein [Cyanothece sp. SIO1E1]